MGYLVQGKCHDTVSLANSHFISYCGVTNSTDTNVGYCEPPTTQGPGVVFVRENVATGVRVVQHTAIVYPSCDVDVNSTTELAWLVAGVWVLAWGFKKMIEVMKR